MAIIWKKTVGDTTYEVRSAGFSTRLYTDGVFHSQYNEKSGLSRGIWDLLMLPLFFNPEGARRILVLGVGGGAVIRQILFHAKPEQVVGIEINPVHLHIARRFFGVRDARVQLLQADAVAWVEQYQGEPFDLVIDDLFTESAGEPVRAVAADGLWAEKLYALLRAGGTLVVNFISRRQLNGSGFARPGSRLRKRVKSAFGFFLPRYENEIGAFLDFESSRRELMAQLSGIPGLDPARLSAGVDFRMRKLRV